MPLLALAWTTLAGAAPEPVEEIIVRSQLRETGFARLPTSAAVLDQQEIGAASVQHFEELLQLVPNLNWSGEGARARYFQVRGTGELEQYEGAPNPSVGLIIDDIDFSSIGAIATTFDIDRVEVLRGPQGTRYGANALAGLVFLRSASPSDTREAVLEGTVGNDGTWAVGGAAGGPLTDDLGYRLSLRLYRNDGFRRNAFLGRDDTYEHDELTGRAKLRWEPRDGWRVDWTGMLADLDNGYDGFAIDNGFTTYSDRPGRDRQETRASSLRVTADLSPAVSLVSITGLANSDILTSFDADWGNDEFWAPFVYDFFQSFSRERDSLNQELRLLSGPDGRLFGGRAGWLGGVYWLGLDETLERFDFGRDDFFCVTPCMSRFDSDYDAGSLALFGELDFDWNDSTSISAGLRWERRDADYADSNGERFSPDDAMLGGDISIFHWLGEGLGTYGRVARGYKAGGFNLDPNVPAGDVRFRPEYLWNYEAGLRARGDDSRWSADLSIFYQDREDLQVKIPVQDELGNPSAFFFFTDNAESGSNYGLELSARWQLSDAFGLHAELGWLKTDIERFRYDPSLEGRDQAHAPEYSFAVGGTWSGPDGWSGRLDVTGQDAFYFDYGHDARSDAYEIVNLSLGRAWGRWSVTAWARNLFDEIYAVRGFFFGNEPPDFPEKLYVRLGDRRHIGITLKYSY